MKVVELINLLDERSKARMSHLTELQCSEKLKKLEKEAHRYLNEQFVFEGVVWRVTENYLIIASQHFDRYFNKKGDRIYVPILFHISFADCFKEQILALSINQNVNFSTSVLEINIYQSPYRDTDIENLSSYFIYLNLLSITG